MYKANSTCLYAVGKIHMELELITEPPHSELRAITGQTHSKGNLI